MIGSPNVNADVAPRRAPSLSAARSIVGRLAIAATLIATLAVAVLCIVIYSVVSSALTQSLSATVDADLAGLADIHATSGRAEVVARIRDRQTMTSFGGHPAHYLLVSKDRVLAGDVRGWPPLSASRSERGYAIIDGTPSYARATRLAPGLDLLVARDTSGERAILRRLIVAFLVGGAAIGATVFGVAWVHFRRLSQRLDRINHAYDQGGSAAIDALTTEQRDDEIGALARHSADALARQARLLDAQRLASDHVAHELRTPLLHLDGRLRSLLGGEPSTATADVLTHARGDIRRITTMLDSLLDIASSEANRGNATGLAPFDLSALATDMADLYRSSMEEAGLQFETSIISAIEMIGEPMQIGRLLANLLDNAVKYVPSGGTIRLSIDPGPTMVVSDDGPGIPPELRPTIFERFHRGRNPGQNPGHGLGLALALAIASRHDLRLTLEDSERGCRFMLRPEASA